jgi:hypothetical protein
LLLRLDALHLRRDWYLATLRTIPPFDFDQERFVAPALRVGVRVIDVRCHVSGCFESGATKVRVRENPSL